MKQQFTRLKKFVDDHSSFAVSLVGAIVIAGASFSLGFVRGQEAPKTIVVKGVTNIGDADAKADFSVFWEAWKALQETHLHGTEVTEQNFIYSAISGLASAFKDPNTIFFPPEESKKFEEDIRGSFGGIGAEIGIKDEQLVVIAPLKDSPAEKAQVKAGDAILKIDGAPTSGISVADAVTKIRGPLGSKITLQMWRTGWGAPKEITLERATIVVPTIITEFKDNNIVHVQISSFNENVPKAFAEAVSQATEKHSPGMILDLRNNPGGFLEIAVDLLGWFVPKGNIAVVEHFREGEDRLFRTDGNGSLKDLPVVVLMNEGSASASEIAAGALRDLRGIKLVGTKSFGKGSVQELHRLHDNSELKITIAEWLTPKKTSIEKNGLKPDVEVEITDADIKNEKDPQLEKAIEVLKAEIANKK